MKRAIILSASAGSGKTYQLALKYVCDIVRHPEKFRNILAVTFTNKATEEMKSRILREIDTLASGAKSSYVNEIRLATGFSEEKIRSQAMRARTLILHDYSRFSVLTIDRFFQRIIRAFIKELGIDLNYNIELDTATLLMRSADELIEDIASNEELRRWMLEYAEERLNDGMRWDMRGELRAMGSEIFKEEAGRNIGNNIDKEALRKRVNDMVARAESCKAKIKSLGEEAVKYIAAQGLTFSSFKGQSRSFTTCFARYAEGELKEPTATMLKATESDDAWYGKDADGGVVVAAAHLRPILEQICRLYSDNISMINTAAILHENYRSYALLGDLYAKVSELCDRESIMILGETKNLLSTFIDESNAPFIYEKVGNRYEYFMIDEFQDTSLREWLNLRPLLLNAMASNPETSVFIVGDVKQSIYRWRGGDWRLLNSQAIEDLGNENSLVKKLKENYRSAPNIVRFNNSFISQVVESDNQHLNTTLDEALLSNKIDKAQHAKLHDIIKNAYTEHAQEIKKSEEEGGYAEVCAFDPKVTDSPFIEAIESAISRGYRYRDILILVRGTTDANKVANALFEYKERAFTSQGVAGFNILTPDSLSIENCDITEFIIAVLRLAVDPRNDIERGVYNRYLGLDFDHRFDEAETEVLRRIAHLSPMEAFEYIISHFRLNERKERIAYLQAMHEQIVSFSTSRIADIQHYLEWWEERGCKESVRVEMTDDTIEITTIHKAKGLESRVVIIPYGKWDLAPRSTLRPVVWAKAPKGSEGVIEERFPVIYNNTMERSAFTSDYYGELVMSHVDGINLLYVAVTRASKELYIYVPYSLNTKSKSSDNVSNTAPLIIKAAETLFPTPELEYRDDSIALKRYRKETRTMQHATSDKQSKENILLGEYISHQPEIKVRHYDSRFREEGLRIGSKSCNHGIALHRIFEQARNFDDLRLALQRLDAGCMLDSEEIAAISHSIAEAEKHPTIKEWFSDVWDDVKCEAEIISRKEIRRPDRVMIAGRRAVIVDYKFGEQRSSSYKRQMAEYVELLRNMGCYDTIEGYVWYITQGVIEKI